MEGGTVVDGMPPDRGTPGPSAGLGTLSMGAGPKRSTPGLTAKVYRNSLVIVIIFQADGKSKVYSLLPITSGRVGVCVRPPASGPTPR